MTQQPSLDPERLAALLDGRLSNAEAAVVRAQLASADDDTLAVYADVVAIVSEMERHQGAPPLVVPIDTARRSRWLRFPLALIAASVLGIVVLKGYTGRQARLAESGPFQYAAALPATIVAPTAPAWSVTRGAEQAVSENGRSVRLGALVTDMDLALAHDDTAVISIAEVMASYLTDIPGAGGVAVALREAARGTTSTRNQDLHRLAQQGIQFTDPALARAGAWIEALRLASPSNAADFVRRFPAGNVLDPLLDRMNADPALRSAMSQMIATSNAKQADPTVLSAAAQQLLHDLAR